MVTEWQAVVRNGRRKEVKNEDGVRWTQRELHCAKSSDRQSIPK